MPSLLFKFCISDLTGMTFVRFHPVIGCCLGIIGNASDFCNSAFLCFADSKLIGTLRSLCVVSICSYVHLTGSPTFRVITFCVAC